MFNSNQAFLIGAKVEISPKGLYASSQGQSAPKLLINAQLYGLVLAPKAEKRIPLETWKANFCNPWGKCSSIYLLINILTSML